MSDLFAITTADPAFAPNKPLTINGFAFVPSDRWAPVEQAPDTDDGGRFIAVHDDPITCDWFFATYLPDGRWLDLSTGGVITPTHWMPLVRSPSETEQRSIGQVAIAADYEAQVAGERLL